MYGTIDIDSLPMAVLIINSSNRTIVSVNQRALSLIGINKNEMLGRVCHNFICPSEMGKCPILDLGQTIDDSERQILTLGGNLISIRKSVSKVERNGTVFLYEAFADIPDTINHRYNLEQIITKHRLQLNDANSLLSQEECSHNKTKNGLKQLSDKYLAFFVNCNDGLALVDFSCGLPPGKYLEVNPALCRMLGYTAEELARLTPLDVVVPGSKERLQKMVRDFFVSESQSLRFENVYLQKTGKEIVLEINARLQYIEDRQVMVCVYRDVSAHKKLEQDLRSSYFRENQSRIELENQLNQRSEFMRALVHELKTPLTPMIASSEHIALQLKDTPLGKYADNIRVGSTNLSIKVDELLDIAKGEVGLLRLSKQYDNIHTVIRQVMDFLLPQTSKMNKQITYASSQEVLKTYYDKKLIYQVLLNLLNNALKFSKRNTTVEIEVTRTECEITVAIIDHGIGIKAGEQERVFQAYNRISQSKDPYGGLGLGLALSKMIIEAHGGRIWFESKFGSGSKFYFTLPIQVPHA